VISYEIPFIKAAFREKGCDPKLVVIVPNKLHNLRFLPTNINRQDKAPEQNVKPGMIVDTQVVHPTWNEFYLCSHTTLQGTANVPRYTILLNESNLSADQIQEATFALAFGYQIVRSPTSLPAPAYIAGKYADRGRTMLKAHLTNETGPLPGPVENEALNQQITLAGNELLRSKRINA
uniref:Piwi domain-containing protein n=1 Tax=Acrobeloides nanus TaxID=290746 RepID=A0A914EMH9_9BILA